MKSEAIRQHLILIPLLFGVVVPVHALGQEIPSAHADHRWGVQVGVLDGDTGEIGVLKQVGDRTQIGFSVGLFTRSSEQEDVTDGSRRESSQWSVEFRPSVRHYLGGSESVVPFLIASAGVGFGELETETSSGVVGESATNTISSRVGFGAEWFPAEQFSLGGFTGLRVRYLDRDVNEDRIDQWDVETFVTSLVAQYYF